VPLSVTLLHLESGASFETSLTTDQSGYFTLTTGLPAGNHQWYVKNPQTLANSSSAALVAGLNNVELGTLETGDANNDNCVFGADFNLLKNSFGRVIGQQGYDPRVDFTGDTVITSPDFVLLRNSFGHCGASPITIPTATVTPLATATATSTPTGMP
jgi:hypothetical protein